MNDHTAIAVLEFDSVAAGTQAADAMIKRAPLDRVRFGTVQPGKYIILVGGAVAAVEEAYREALRLEGGALRDHILLADVAAQVYDAVQGTRRANDGDALGILEMASIPATVRAADRAVKTADVCVVEIRLGDGLGGKGLTHLSGKVHDVAAAVEAAMATSGDPANARWVIIPRQHLELRQRIERSTAFTE